MQKHYAVAMAIAMAVGMMSGTARAADLYSSGAKTWDTATTNWGTVTGGPYDAAAWNNATPDAATFEGTGGAVTLGEAITVGGLTFNATNYTIATGANTLTFGAATNAIIFGKSTVAAATITGAVGGGGNVTL